MLKHLDGFSVHSSETIIKRPLSWLALISLFQILFWTLGPWFTRHTLVSDTLEGIAWGNLWQWGYDKHPPLAAWVTAIFARLGETPDLPVYLLAQLCVVIAFIAVWRLSKEYLTGTGALLAVFLLQGVLFYSNRVERVTPDTLQSPIWALLALSFYFAVTRQSMKQWLLCGILAGLAVLSKYQAAVLFLPLFLCLILTVEGRASLKTAGPWLAGILALVIITPHLVWLYENSFAAINYVESNYVNDADNKGKDWVAHFITPFEFALNSLSNVLLLLLLFWPFYRKSGLKTFDGEFKTVFLLAIALGPTLLTMLFGLFTGEKLVPRWATPYFAWLPLLMFYWFQPEISYRQFVRTVVLCLLTGLTLWSLRMAYLYYQPLFNEDYHEADEFLPAQEEMLKAEQLWRQYYDYPIPYLGGLHYHVTELVAYSRSGTIPYLGLNPAESLWMEEEDFLLRGGIIVIREGDRHTRLVSERLKQNYPEAVFLDTFKFKPHINIEVEDTRWTTIHYYLLEPAAIRQSRQ
ncbi:MAG: glycosyltransferase family 39 protein [Endozoicomonas sp.]